MLLLGKEGGPPGAAFAGGDDVAANVLVVANLA
jgi:hypothetical protein